MIIDLVLLFLFAWCPLADGTSIENWIILNLYLETNTVLQNIDQNWHSFVNWNLAKRVRPTPGLLCRMSTSWNKMLCILLYSNHFHLSSYIYFFKGGYFEWNSIYCGGEGLPQVANWILVLEGCTAQKRWGKSSMLGTTTIEWNGWGP